MPSSSDPMAAIRLNRIAMPVGSLGFGQRAVIWVQGCTIGCPGCISRHTWNRKGGEEIALDALIELLGRQEARSGPFDGLTISGGEPMEQAKAVFMLVERLRDRNWLGPTRDVLVYSGLGAAALNDRFGSRLDLFDAMVAGPFKRRIPGHGLAGSGNQRIIPLTALGQARYIGEPQALWPLEGVVNDDILLLAGVPHRGETEQFRILLEEQGVRLV